MCSAQICLRGAAWSTGQRRLTPLRAAKQAVAKELREPRPENVPGDFFVDRTCIDCDTCRFMSPDVFTRVGAQSAVYKQPENDQERLATMQALLSCPTYSIHVKKTRRGEVGDVQATFPIPVEGTEDIYFCGFTDEKAYAASAYFIRSKHGNILVDSPRFNPALVRGFDALGGVESIFLTHMSDKRPLDWFSGLSCRDDVGDHAKWAEHYDIPRIIHQADVDVGTEACEIQLEGEGPWTVGDDRDSDEMEIIYTPGHTRGSLCLFHKPSKTMFTGDHFLYSWKTRSFSMLAEYNKDDPALQLQSILKLTEYDFLRLIPGHQRRYEFSSFEEKNQILRDFVKQNRG